jgi:hypothetical protein
MLRATVSGSFHRHMSAIYDAVGALREAGVDVLSPSDPRVVDFIGEFLFVASDKLRSVKLVQDRHFEAIRNSDLLWVAAPDGYTGVSTAAEIGAAYACGVPVYSDALPVDVTLSNYVRRVAGVGEAVRLVAESGRRRPDRRHVLLDPASVIEGSIGELEQMRTILEGRSHARPEDADKAYCDVMKSLLGGAPAPRR